MGRNFSNREPVRGAGHESNNPASGNCLRPEARPSLDKARLGGLVDIISNIGFKESRAKSKDVVGRVHEYFLSNFASAEVKGGGEFYAPQCAAQALVAMLEPYKGLTFDPCCGSVDMFLSLGESLECDDGQLNPVRQTADTRLKGEHEDFQQFYTPSCVVRRLIAIRSTFGHADGVFRTITV